MTTPLVLLGLLGLSTPAVAQDSPWGPSTDSEDEASDSADEAEEAEGDDAEEEGDAEEGDAEEGEEEAEEEAEEEEPEPLELAEAGAEIDKIEVVVDPETSAPGTDVEVTVIFWTAEGKAVPEVGFDLLGKGGSIGDVTEDGGRYTAVFTIGVETEDAAKVNVVTEGGQMGLVSITVEGDPVQPEVEEAPVAKTKAPKQPVDRDPEWLHLRAAGAFGMYSYSQDPARNPGPLIEDTLSFGGSDPAAGAAGADLHARMWLKDQPYLGFQVDFRFLGYAVESSAFGAVASDWLYDAGVYLAGRKTLEVGSGQLSLGGRVGFHYDDYLVFAGCLDPGCSVSFDSINGAGLGIGPRVGFETGSWSADAGLTLGLARVTQPTSRSIDLNVGYVAFDPISIELGVETISRSIVLTGADSGEVRGTIEDGQMLGSLGVGLVF